ncbi:MAG: methylated-DNA--[protein]-cysteine S-methyltransferase [Crocinitomicaceae bacterium]
MKTNANVDANSELDFNRISSAIGFIVSRLKEQPTIEEIAAHVHLSEDHFRRIFNRWAGVSPKKFIHYLSLQYAKRLLLEKQATLFETTLEIGLSSTSRLHDLFVKMEGMSPKEYKNGGENLQISYCFSSTHFGEIIIASTGKGICFLSFHQENETALQDLMCLFPKAYFYENCDSHQAAIITFFENKTHFSLPIHLHLNGTSFQMKVWEALLKIPNGEVSTYGKLAKSIDNPNASRAVGTAIGSNPIAFILPCHRVIQSTGNTGGYRWGETRKRAILAWEAAQNTSRND